MKPTSIAIDVVDVGGVKVRRITIDCPHGTTTGDLVSPASGVEDVVAVLAARHEAEERCGCALPLLGDGARA